MRWYSTSAGCLGWGMLRRSLFKMLAVPLLVAADIMPTGQKTIKFDSGWQDPVEDTQRLEFYKVNEHQARFYISRYGKPDPYWKKTFDPEPGMVSVKLAKDMVAPRHQIDEEFEGGLFSRIVTHFFNRKENREYA